MDGKLALPQGIGPAPRAAQVRPATIQLYASPSEATLARNLEGLFRNVGFIVAYHGSTPPQPAAEDEIASRIVLAAPDAGEAKVVLTRLLERGESQAPLLLITRAGDLRRHLTDPAVARRIKVIEAAGDTYDVFEKIAVRLGLDVRTDVFLSYSRRDRVAAEALTGELIDRGHRPWVDRRDLQPSEEWLQALRQGVRASDSFLLLVSQASVASEHCLRELGWAVEFGKRIIPVLLEPIPAAELPEAVRARQWIEIPEGRPIDTGVDAVVASLERDPRIVHLHGELLRQALAWKQTNEDPSLLLRGSELLAAEEWLGVASARGEPRPTELHSAFIFASRSAQRSRQRQLWVIASGVLLLTAALAIWAVLNAREATKKAKEARSHLAEQRAFASYVNWDVDPVKAFLLADSAMRTAPEDDALRPTYEAMTRNLAQEMPEAVTNLETGVLTAAFSPDLAHVFVHSPDRSLVAPISGRPGKLVALAEVEPFLEYRQVKFSADGSYVAAIVKPFFGQSPHRLVAWRADNGVCIGIASLAQMPGSRPPEIVGFLPDGRSILVQAGGGKDGYHAYRLALWNLAAGPRLPVFSSADLLLLGQVDLASSTIVQLRRADDRGGQLLELLDIESGTPRCVPLRLDGKIRQVFLARGGRAVAVVAETEGGAASSLSSWVLNGRSLAPVGSLEAPVAARIWDLTADGTSAAVMSSGADYPAEVWSLRRGSRVTVPVSTRVASIFIMKDGEEYRPLSFVGGDRWLLVREPLGNPLQGERRQQLLLFDRESLQLMAAPFFLQIDYLALRADPGSTRFSTVSHDGIVEQWNLVRPLPRAFALPLPGEVLDARFSEDQHQVFTMSRLSRQGKYVAQIDVWDVQTGHHAGQLPQIFPIRTHFCLHPAGRVLATVASGEGGGYRLLVWDLEKLTPIWSRESSGPVEAVSFLAGGSRIGTAGAHSDHRAVLLAYDTRTGRSLSSIHPDLPANSVHLAFSADGDALIADFGYSSIAIWSITGQGQLGKALPFSDAAGLPFDLGYDIVLNLRQIHVDRAGEVRGSLPGNVVVVLRREGPGTTIVPAGSETPVLSAFSSGGARLYPVRGADLLSPNGRWFNLATNVTTVERASGLRVYDFASGLPVTGLLLHQSAARPGEAWPRLLSRLVSEVDPVVSATFVEATGRLVTITTNGLLRHWPVLRGPGRKPLWSAPAEIATALTGRRLINERAIRRLPEADYLRLRSAAAAALAEFLDDRAQP